ncbi:hypothetical protein K439DRAFT_1082353 [Ramaria rubella]|nr:hypothetical protein K439DRAFT_1082353 [Ramaria rubella]
MMLLASVSRHVLRVGQPCFRHSSSSTPTSSIKLVAELRKRTTATIKKAREALTASEGDLSGALEWLERDRVLTGQQKAEKVSGRFAGEGLIGVCVLSRGSRNRCEEGIRAAMIEVNCETDFVGRNELFRKLTQDLAFTVARMANRPLSLAPIDQASSLILPVNLKHLQETILTLRDNEHKELTVSESIREVILAVGENISIRRAVLFSHNPIPPQSGMGLRIGHYVHCALPKPEHPSTLAIDVQGKLGALVAVELRTSPASRLEELLDDETFETKLSSLERGLARQIVGLRASSVCGEGDKALYNQSFDMLATSGGENVETVLRTWAVNNTMTRKEKEGGLNVLEFLRWEVGENS